MIRLPPLRILIALALVVLVAATFAWLSETYAVALLAVVVATFGAYGWSYPLKLIPWIGLGIVLAFAFGMKWFFLPADPRDGLRSMGLALAEFLLMAQAVQFLVYGKDRPLGPMYLLLSVAALLGAGLVRVNALQSAVYQGVVLLFVALIAYHAALERPVQRVGEGRRSRLRASLLAAMMLLAGASSVGGSVYVSRKWNDIESFLNERFRAKTNLIPESAQDAIRFARRRKSTLGSVDLRGGGGQLDQIALRISSNSVPLYLRGGTFDKYELSSSGEDQWGTVFDMERMPPTTMLPANMPALQPRENPFVIRRVAAPLPRVMEIWPEVESDTIFTDLHTSVVAAPVGEVRVDDNEIVVASEFPPNQSYRLFGFEAQNVSGLNLEDKEILTDIPPHLREVLHEYATKIFKGRTTPEEKIAALEEYFDANYQYSLVVKVPEDEHPLTYFLKRRPPAHCEFFATATVMLLRAGGVPARYVYGYAGGSEYNHLGRYWIVRQKSAHAWAEAYVEGAGWQVVETTPSAGINQPASRPQVSHLWDNLLLKIRMVRALLTRGGGRATLQAMWILFSALFTTVPGLLVTAILSVIFWRWLRPFLRRSRKNEEMVSPRVRELRKLLARIERRLDRRELTRGAGETLNQFALRLQEAAQREPRLQPVADWYLQYAAARYGTDLDTESVSRLRISAEALGMI